jgi:hypothetical protein
LTKGELIPIYFGNISRQFVLSLLLATISNTHATKCTTSFVYLLPNFVVSSVVVVIAVLDKADDVSNPFAMDFEVLERLM